MPKEISPIINNQLSVSRKIVIGSIIILGSYEKRTIELIEIIKPLDRPIDEAIRDRAIEILIEGSKLIDKIEKKIESCRTEPDFDAYYPDLNRIKDRVNASMQMITKLFYPRKATLFPIHE
jgi:hypothetical protein